MAEKLSADDTYDFEYEIMKYKLANDALSVALWDMDVVDGDPINPHNTFTWSQEFRHMLGFSDENDFPNKLLSWSDRLHPEDKDRTLGAFAAHLNDRTGKTPYDLEYRLMLKNGDYRHFHALGTTLRDKDGVPLRVAGALLDITETKSMADAIEYRDKLLDAANKTANVLLTTNAENFSDSLSYGMETIARIIDADRVYIMQNEMIDGELYFVYKYEWINDIGKEGTDTTIGSKAPYSFDAEWSERFKNGECMNSPLTSLSENIQRFFSRINIKSVLVIPIFIEDIFWGLVSFSDCRNERFFTDDEVNILRSGALMMVSAINSNDQIAEINEIKNRSMLLLDSAPFTCHLWNRNLEMFDCNEANVRFFKLNSKAEVMEQFFRFSPEFQPDGRLSSEVAAGYLNKAFETGHSEGEYMHIDSDGNPLPVQITIDRVPYGNDFVVAAYARDLREHQKNMEEIALRDSLLSETNRVANILLQSDAENFDTNLNRCLEMIGNAVEVDKIRIWENHEENGRLFCTKTHEWFSGPVHENGLFTSICYDEVLPGWEKTLAGGNCINILVKDTSPKVQDLLSAQNILSVLIVPVIVKEKFWGYIGYYDCRDENLFSENEQAILSSSSMIIVNALLNNQTLIEMKELHKRLEEENIHTLKQFEMIWDEVDSGMVIIDIENRTLLDVNPAACRMFEGQREEMLGEICYKFFGQHDCPILDENRTLDREERQFIKSDGTIIPVLKSVSRIIYDGKPALLESFTDISYLKAVNEQKRMLEVAEQANSAKSEFLANISHEMRTPLNAVLGLSGLTLEMEDLSEEAAVNLEKIYSSGSTLLNIVNDILDISKIEAGKLELIPNEYDIPSLINDVITQNILRIGSKLIEFSMDITPEIYASLYGDDLRIKQVFNNILSNAFKYTEKGTVEFGIRTEPAEKDGTVWVTAWVKDTGMGIRPEDVKKLFSDYTQVDTKANRSIEGTGLGLSLTKKMVELMDGTINVESEYGKGSKFTVRYKQKFVSDTKIGGSVVNNLQSFNYSDAKRRQTARINRIKMPYARVLVVDDNLTNLDVAKGLMKPYGMQVDCVTRGQYAIDLVIKEEVKYDAIFMDHMMPEMDGIEATKRIREIPTDYAKNIPILALTANAIAGNEEKFLNNGFQGFLSKPIDLPRLDEALKRWVRNREKEAEMQIDAETEEETVTAPASGWLSGKEIPGLRIKKGIERFGGDEDTFLKVLESYTVNSRPILERIRGVDSGNLSEYTTDVHGLKGSSRGIFAEKIGDMAEKLEESAKDGDIDFVNKNNAAFIDALYKLIADIEEILVLKNAENPKPHKEAPDKETLFDLVSACEEYDIDGVNRIMAIIDEYEYDSAGEQVAWLKDNILEGNLDEIAEKLSGRI